MIDLKERERKREGDKSRRDPEQIRANA